MNALPVQMLCEEPPALTTSAAADLLREALAAHDAQAAWNPAAWFERVRALLLGDQAAGAAVSLSPAFLDSIDAELDATAAEDGAMPSPLSSIAMEALESIALAGMSGSGQESEEGMTAWHARRAWEFIGIASRAIEAIRFAAAAPALPTSAAQVGAELDPESIEQGDAS